MDKKIQIDLASKKSTAYENFKEIQKAIYNASLGLYSKFGVQILNVLPIDGKVVMEIRIPDDIVENFGIGNHMRGVSAYLLKNYSEKFSHLVVGKRLLNYTDIATMPKENNNFSFHAKLSAMCKFAELLKRDDDESTTKISKIITILYEEDEEV